MKIDRFVEDSRTFSGIQDNNSASKLQLDEKYETTDNIFSITSTNIGVNDSHSNSGSSEIDEYASYIEDKYDNVNELILEHKNNFVIHYHEHIIAEVNREYIDI